MRIAFDVKGTLQGFNSEKVQRLFRLLAEQGHEMFIWSNSLSYAIEETVKMEERGLKAVATNKLSTFEAEDRSEPLMDIAIEDDWSQTWLAAKRIVFVGDIPDDVESFAKLLTSP